MLRPKAVTQSQVLTDGVDTVGAHVDYARETGEITIYNKLYYIGIGGLPMPEKQEDKNGETNSGLCSLYTSRNCRVHHVTKAVRCQGNEAVLPTQQCRERKATGMSGNGRRNMKCAVGTKR